MISRSLVLGYHGCDASTVEEVVLGKAALKASINNHDWLGHGIYFWEDSPDRALRWAREAQERKPHKIRKPAVLGAVIDLGNCLNLSDSAHLAFVREVHQGAMEMYRRENLPPPVNKGRDLGARYLDCEVMRLLHAYRESKGERPFDTVRGFFIEGDELYPGSGFRTLDHVQICVRNPARILGYFIPRHPA